jgi:hypothetical protein
MLKKRKKFKEKLSNFADWELTFMRSGPPSLEAQKTSGHGFAYLSGIHIWERLQREPDFKVSDFPWAARAFRNFKDQ